MDLNQRITLLQSALLSHLSMLPWCPRSDSNRHGLLAHRIFLLLYVTIALIYLAPLLSGGTLSVYFIPRTRHILSCSLDYVFTVSYDLGGWCIVSTHLFGYIFPTIGIRQGVTIGTQQFIIFYCIVVPVTVFMVEF